MGAVRLNSSSLNFCGKGQPKDLIWRQLSPNTYTFRRRTGNSREGWLLILRLGRSRMPAQQRNECVQYRSGSFPRGQSCVPIRTTVEVAVMLYRFDGCSGPSGLTHVQIFATEKSGRFPSRPSTRRQGTERNGLDKGRLVDSSGEGAGVLGTETARWVGERERRGRCWRSSIRV